MDTVLVAAAVLVERGRVLVTQRKPEAHLGGAWEFPGGKVQPGEDPREALRRELREELGLDVAVGDVVEVTFHRYPEIGRPLLLLFFEATRAPGSPEPQALDVAAFAWAGEPDLADLHFPPADIAVLRRVRERLKTA